MRVLASVFANAGRVTLDVSGIPFPPIEGRGQKQDDLSVPPDQVASDGVHGAFGPGRRRSLREDGPRLRDRVDLALVVLCRTERAPVVEVRATIPVAVPCQLERAGQALRL